MLVYSVLNLIIYLSQVLIIPRLATLYQVEKYRLAAELLLRLSIQQLPSSAVYTLNNLAYAILGIPSIIYGTMLFRERGWKRISGLFMSLNGIACIVRMVGIVLGNRLLGQGSLVGGILFLFALIALSRAFLREG